MYQMYETISEGTPISPPMELPEQLARWLADNNIKASGALAYTYEQWLAMIVDSRSSAGRATTMENGVAAAARQTEEKQR